MKHKQIYNSFNKDPYHTHVKLLNKIRVNSTVLEIGSATGYFTNMLLKKGCKVTAVEKDKRAYMMSKKIKGVRFINDDVVNIKKQISTRSKFDHILLADILEHTASPLRVLRLLKDYLKQDGAFVISIPNSANFSVRLMLLRGKFTYQEYGIMDKTHLHFFTNNSIRRMFNNLNLNVVDFDVVSGFETSGIYKKTIGPVIFRIDLLRRIEYLITKLLPGLFALEFIYVVKKNK